MTVRETIAARRSVKKFAPQPVEREKVERMLDAAVWAPNHRLTEPWSFYVVATAEAKERFLAIRAQMMLANVPDPPADLVERVHRGAQDIRETPVLIFVGCDPSRQPPGEEWEDFVSVGAAVQNMMLAAMEEGLGTHWRSGRILNDPGLRRWLGLTEQQQLVGMIYVGYPLEHRPPRRTPAPEKTVWM